MADAPELAKVPSPAGRQGSEKSAIHETRGLEAQGSRSPLDPDAPREPTPSEDFATKSYDLEELNRLRAMSNPVPPAPVVTAREVSEDEEEADDSTTGRLDIRGQARSGSLPSVSAVDLDYDAEDQTTSRMSVRRAGANRPAAGSRGSVPTRPDGRATTAAAPPPEQALRAPEGAAGAPSEIEDEDSNDEGPTVRRGKKSDVNNERAVLARPPSGRVELPTDIEDDPLDDGPTRMRPPEELAPVAEPVLKPLRSPAAGVNEAPWARPHEESDTLSGPTERLPEAIGSSARASSKPRLGATLPVTPPPPPAWDAAEAQAPTRALPKLGGTQPLAPVPPQLIAPPPAGPPQVQLPPVAPPVAPPLGAPPIGAQGGTSSTAAPMGALSLGGPPPVAPAGAGRQRLIAALVGVALGLVVLIVYGALAEPDAILSSLSPSASASASAPASAEPATSAQPAPSPTASAAAVPSSLEVGEKEAREALSRLRDGISACVDRGSNALPGAAAAVPSSLKQTRPDGYAVKADEWKATIWSCAKFSATAPMRYQIQWQTDKAFQEGTAIAWIDGDDDGNADRALSFHVSLKSKGKIEVSEIGPADASTKVMPKH